MPLFVKHLPDLLDMVRKFECHVPLLDSQHQAILNLLANPKLCRKPDWDCA